MNSFLISIGTNSEREGGSSSNHIIRISKGLELPYYDNGIKLTKHNPIAGPIFSYLCVAIGSSIGI